MTVRIQDIAVGRCYVTASEQVRLVLEIIPGSRVCWTDVRHCQASRKREIITSQKFAREVDCEVTCDYEPSYLKRMASGLVR